MRFPTRRYSTYALSLALFITACLSCSFWSTKGFSSIVSQLLLASALLSSCLFFLLVPRATRLAHLDKLTGRNYLVLFEVSMITAIPALLLIGFGWGSITSSGLQWTNLSIANISREVDIGDILFLSDGYVGTNASIGLVTTLKAYQLPKWDSLYTSPGQSSFYSQVLLSGNTTDVATLYPDSRQIITVAPIFKTETICNLSLIHI